MTRVQISVTANISALQKKIDALGCKIDQTNRKKWSPIAPAGVERDAAKIEQTPVCTKRWVSESGNPTLSRSDDALQECTLRPQQYGIRKRYAYAPELNDVPRFPPSGFGGGLGHVAGAGSRGVIAGAQEGEDLLGGALRHLRGVGIGALAFGAFKAVSSASEGVGMARQRAGTLDTPKRQMGDLGISFDRLKVAIDSAAYGLALNSKGFATLEQMKVANRARLRIRARL